MKRSNPDPFSLRGEVAVVTGGATGLGLAMARSIVAAGGRVVLAGRREAPLKSAAGELGRCASFVVHDVTDVAGAPAFAERAAAAFGPASILVSNAGIHLKKPALTTSEIEFQALWTSHVLAAHTLVRTFAAPMLERGHGSILFIASMASFIGLPGLVAYGAAKSALLGMVRCLATEWSAGGVRVNAIAPGWIDSAMMRRALADDPSREARVLARTPMGRFGRADEIGPAAVFLCSPAASFVTGTCLVVDGGAAIGF